MTASVDLRPEHLAIAFKGVDAALSLQRELVLPWSEVASVRVADRREAQRDLGWRVGGGYWPGWLATGHYTWRGRKGERQLWCVYRASRVLVIDTTRARPRRVVLQVDDPDALAARIGAVLSGNS